MDELIPNLRDERVQGAVKNLLVYSIVILLVPLGSMFLLKRYMFEDSPVFLGFGIDLKIDDLYRLRSIFLPLGKIGGKPSWLNPKFLPKTADLECGVCQKAMCFLIQIYATEESDPPHAFHRTLFVFICRNSLCSKNNDAANMAVFRCCLPRTNPFYSFDGPLDPDLDGDVLDPHLPDDAPNLCRICGCYASKKCGRCGTVWYCCREHQALDWTTVHKDVCGGDDASDLLSTNPSNKFLFKEYGIEMGKEYVPADFFESDDDEDNDQDEVSSNVVDVEKKNMTEYKAYLASNEGNNENFETEDIESAVSDQHNDLKFERFRRLLNLNSEQVLRYQRSGTPLWATDGAPTLDEAPPCEKCGAARCFELQLMPHLLSLIDVDQLGNSIDWASVYIYTCSRTCEIESNGYAKEFIFKQDF